MTRSEIHNLLNRLSSSSSAAMHVSNTHTPIHTLTKNNHSQTLTDQLFPASDDNNALVMNDWKSSIKY